MQNLKIIKSVHKILTVHRAKIHSTILTLEQFLKLEIQMTWR